MIDPSSSTSLRPKLLVGARLVLITALLGLAPLSCGANCQDPKNALSATCVIEGAIVDCTGVSSLSTAVSEAGPIVAQLLNSALQADGTIAWAGIEGTLITLAFKYGMCTIAEIWNGLVNGIVPGSGSGSSGSAGSDGSSGSATPNLAKLKLSASDLAAEFDRIRSKVSPGRKFKVRGGATL